MALASQDQLKARKFRLSTDGWAVLTAMVLALLVRVGLIHRVPW
jgi:hypothetical protein